MIMVIVNITECLDIKNVPDILGSSFLHVCLITLVPTLIGNSSRILSSNVPGNLRTLLSISSIPTSFLTEKEHFNLWMG